MRDKQQILEEIHRQELQGGTILFAVFTGLRLLTEPLIDIRDILQEHLPLILSHLIHDSN